MNIIFISTPPFDILYTGEVYQDWKWLTEALMLFECMKSKAELDWKLSLDVCMPQYDNTTIRSDPIRRAQGPA